MGLELGLSELAALRPIRTAVSGARRRARAPEDGGEDAAADTGPVTPTTARRSMAPRQDEDGSVDTGCVTPTMASGAGVTARRDVGEDRAGCATPTSAASALRPAAVCPPAPRKPRPAKRKRCGRPTAAAAPLPQRFFFPVPQDLDAVFVARVAGASPPCGPLAKKIRVHVVG